MSNGAKETPFIRCGEAFYKLLRKAGLVRSSVLRETIREETRRHEAIRIRAVVAATRKAREDRKHIREIVEQLRLMEVRHENRRNCIRWHCDLDMSLFFHDERHREIMFDDLALRFRHAISDWRVAEKW